MKRKLIKVGELKKTRQVRPTNGKSVVAKMTANPVNFPPAECGAMLTSLDTISKDLETANAAAKSGNREDVALANEKAVEFDSQLNIVALYVQGKADADPTNAESIILSAGFGVRKDRSKRPAPDAVTIISALYSTTPKSILVEWKSAKYASLYDLYFSTDQMNWTLVQSLAGRKMMVTSLTSGTRYYFKVVAKNIHGTTNSDAIATCIAA